MVESDEDSESSSCTEDTNDSSSSSIASSSSSDSSGCSSNSSSTSDSDKLPRQQQQQQDEDNYALQVRSWTNRVPIGLGLCPWAMKSQRRGHLHYRTCQGSTPSDVAILIRSEAKQLLDGDVVPPLSSSLIVCPHVTAWNDDFNVFDNFVKGFGTLKFCEEEEKDLLLQKLTLVSFHPQFLRWRGLPNGIQIGSVVHSYKGMGGFQKSAQTCSATVIQTVTKAFGLRKIKVNFHDDDKEQYVPVDWLVLDDDDEDDDENVGQPLPDNAMHRAPYPTVHLIRNEDLGHLCIRDVSRVKRKNAQRMMKLGWEGVAKATATDKKVVGT